MTITFPVNNSAPVRITKVNPAGNPTAPLRKLHKPGLLLANAGLAPPMQDINSAPIPINAPALNPKANVAPGACFDFITDALATAWLIWMSWG
tara:strand:- start:128 stop:406 length:279 start_codon:yes stop_codon:yes gene_type:complete